MATTRPVSGAKATGPSEKRPRRRRTATPRPAETRPGAGLKAPAREAPGGPDAPVSAFATLPAATRPIRVLIVEEVPELATHLRELLRAQPGVKLVHTLNDGGRVVDEVRDLQPDVVLVDALLQGKVKGPTVLKQLAEAEPSVGTVALTLRDAFLASQTQAMADEQLALPFGTFELSRAIRGAHEQASRRNPGATSRVITIFGAKGGVGRTTLAYNLAVALAQTGLHSMLLDGSLQFGDLRRLLRAPDTFPSICDLPTDAVRASDIADALVDVEPNVDVLFGPPRLEMAELVGGRDLERIIDLVRSTHQAVVIDTPVTLSEPTLALLDAADVILLVLTTDAACVNATRATAEMFAEIGYPPTRVRYLVNRSDARGGLTLGQVARSLGRPPDYTVASDWQLVSTSNVEGAPFVVARPEARASQDLAAVAADLRGVVGSVPSPKRARAAARA